MTNTPRKFPEEVLGGILKLSAGCLGDIELSTTTNSTLIESPEPQYVFGLIEARLRFKIVSRDKTLLRNIEDSFQNGEGFGSLRISMYNVTLTSPWNIWIADVQAYLLHGPESRDIINSFALA